MKHCIFCILLSALKRVWAQCTKELVQFQRDRLAVVLILVLPLATLLSYGFAIRLEAKEIPLVIQDFDHSSLSRAYIGQLFATNQFKYAPWHSSVPIEDAIDRNIAKAAVTIPPDFSRCIKSGKPVTVQVLVNGTDVNNALLIKQSIKSMTDFFLSSAGLQPGYEKINAHIRVWFNPGGKETLYLVPGVYALVLWVYPSLLSAMAMAREKEQGTIIQVYASSLSATELLLGKSLAYFLVGLSEALFIMVLGALIFELRLVTDPTPLLVGTSVFVLDSVLFGLFIGVKSNTQSVAFQGVTSIGYLASAFLSGIIYPLSNIPFPLSLVSNLVPARYYIELTRDAFVRGTGWSAVWFFTLVLGLQGLVLFYATWREIHCMQLSE